MKKKIKPIFSLNPKIWQTILAGITLISFIFIMLFIIVAVWIDRGVKTECDLAKKEFGEGECVEALSVKVQNEQIPLTDRNKVVWALGQLNDNRALPILNSLYTGEKCDHENFLCQYELQKAIKLLGGEFNVTQLVRKSYH